MRHTLLTLSLAAAASIAPILSSCSSVPEGPAAITTHILDAASKGDFKPFVDSFDLSDEDRAVFKGLMSDKGKTYFADKKGIRSSEIVSEDFDGNICTLTVKVKYGNGTSETMYFSYEKRGEKWVQVFTK